MRGVAIALGCLLVALAAVFLAMGAAVLGMYRTVAALLLAAVTAGAVSMCVLVAVVAVEVWRRDDHQPSDGVNPLPPCPCGRPLSEPGDERCGHAIGLHEPNSGRNVNHEM